MIGEKISHYKILKKIGHGGMGTVYKARDTRLLRHVAIKILSSELIFKKNSLTKLLQEAQTASAINHHNICTIYDVGSIDDIHYMIMEYIEGDTLRDILTRRGSLPAKEVVEIGIKLCEALAAPHSKGIIHRDIKPENIIISYNGHLKLMDFGLAKIKSSEHELCLYQKLSPVESSPECNFSISNTAISGTVSYMSPEQVDNKLTDERSDIFSLGIVLYELFTGEPPFIGKDKIEIMESILSKNPTRPSEKKNHLIKKSIKLY